MDIDQRLDRLTERHEALTQSVELFVASTRGNLDRFEVQGADRVQGAFLPPLLLLSRNPSAARAVHEVEALRQRPHPWEFAMYFDI